MSYRDETPDRKRYAEVIETEIGAEFTIPEGYEATSMCIVKKPGKNLKGHDVYNAVILIQEHWR